MTLRQSVLPIAFFSFWLAGCKKKDFIAPEPEPTTPQIITVENNRLSAVITGQTTTAFISGTVLDETGKTLAGINVLCGNQTVTTNEKGYYQYAGPVTVNKDYALITASGPGYFKGFKTFTPNPSGKANHYFEFRLLKAGLPKALSDAGGIVELDNKINLSFPQGAVVTSSGLPYTGQYNVVGRYIDPAAANFSGTMPGQLTGLNDQEQLRALRSFGMAAVELKDGAGNLLQVAPGKKVTMKLPAPANGPATIPLWHFNEKHGLWVKAAEATKTGNTYTGEVTHFSTWNLDIELNSFRLELVFKDPSGNALPGLRGEAYLEGFDKLSSFYTDNEGKVILLNCPSSQALTIKTYFECDTAITALSPITASRTEIITVPTGPGVKSYTISGKLSGCNNSTLANQAFRLAIQGNGSSLGVPAVTDANGDYSVTAMFCNNSNSPIDVQAISFLGEKFRYAPVATISGAAAVYNAQICDTTESVDDDFQVIFPDPALDSLIRQEIKKPSGAIFYRDIKNIDTLVGYNKINDLTGIQFCTKLQAIDFYGGIGFSDLSLLEHLLSLRRLVIMETGNGLITDISPLRNLSQLKNLTLGCPRLADISHLGNLPQIENLLLISNSLSDLSPLVNLTRMTWLSITGNAITDLSPLSGMTKLKSLTLRGLGLGAASLQVLKNFKLVEDLTIQSTGISDFSVVQELPALLFLHLDWNQVSDLGQFAPLTNLVSLELEKNKITDITALQSLTNLQYLKLSYNQISDITALQHMPLVKIISADFNRITDVTPLQHLDNLQLLWLSNNNISNIQPLINGVKKLESLRMVQQQNGPPPQSQRDAFIAAHPNCSAQW